MGVIKREKVLTTLEVKQIPPGLCWGKPDDFVRLLTQMLTITLNINSNNDFVVIGHQTPSEDDKNRLWIRMSRSGSFMGFYLFIAGRWQRVHNYRNDEVIWMTGRSTNIPDGFQLIDGTVGGIDTDTQRHIMNFYEIDSTVTSTVPVYKYFAVRYLGA